MKRFSMFDAKIVSVHLDTHVKLSHNEYPETENERE